jgi:two-component system, chemotaxis family, sensor kinase CheA
MPVPCPVGTNPASRPELACDKRKEREDAVAESFDLGSLLGEFRDEARDQVDVLDAALLRLEREGWLDEGGRAELLRNLHTLKGNAGMLGFSAIRDFVHVVETLLREEPSRESPATLDRLFGGATALRRAVELAGSPGEEEAFRELTAARHRLDELEAGDGGPGDGPTRSAEEPSPAREEDRLRVPFEKLDALLSEVGELLGETDAMIHATKSAPRATAREHAVAVRHRVDRLRDAVMTLRLVPLSRVLSRFHGLARRLAREQGKEARLVLQGEATEVDKSTADALAEPILHLVRNAIDHGIEAPDVRERAGKPRYGTVRILADQVGDRVRIQVEDDGAGPDLDAVRRQADAAGLGGAGLSDAEAAELIFEPGLSTRTDVSTVSGRGVGLDVVRRRAQTLRGTLTVERPAAGGTRFVMVLPLTVAIVPSLVFEAAGETVAFPAVAVVRTIPLDRIERVGPGEFVRDGEGLLPVVDLAEVFGWPVGRPGDFGVMVRHGPRGAVVRAARLVDQRDLVVKALPAFGARPTGVSGASALPGGRVILVLDPADVIELAGRTPREVEA